MKFSNVFVESLGYVLPDEIWTSADIEKRLQPVYERLRLPEGRLELMTGIRERRFWPRATQPSQLSVLSCENALRAADFDRAQIGLLIHGSVCRDFLSATACSVHHRVGLPPDCVVYDLSNACLGILNGMLQAANMIELGQIKASLVVGSKGGRQLVETTIQSLNQDLRWNRQSIKEAVASLTIGSASCAILLTNGELSRSGNRLVAGAIRAHSEWHALCQSENGQAGADFRPLMTTDSNMLLEQGVRTGQATFQKFIAVTGWSISDIDRTVCHQVGIAHQKLMLESLGLSPANDYTTFPWSGNTGAVALPVTWALASENQFLSTGQKLALLGIGSGINSIMLGLQWTSNQVQGTRYSAG